MDRSESIRAVLLAEYQALKDEQVRRIQVRDNLIYATLATLAAVTVAAFRNDMDGVLLAVPAVCFVLGWTHLINDEKVSAIGRYLRDHLAPQLESTVQGSPLLFGWEFSHRFIRRRRSQKLVQLLANLITFCVPGLLSVGVYWQRSSFSPAEVAASIVGVLLTCLLVYQMSVHAELRTASPIPARADRTDHDAAP